jgi:hypothetical protein
MTESMIVDALFVIAAVAVAIAGVFAAIIVNNSLKPIKRHIVAQPYPHKKPPPGAILPDTEERG